MSSKGQRSSSLNVKNFKKLPHVKHTCLLMGGHWGLRHQLPTRPNALLGLFTVGALDARQSERWPHIMTERGTNIFLAKSHYSTINFDFCLTGQLFHIYSSPGFLKSELLCTAEAELSPGLMFFLSPNRLCQSPECRDGLTDTTAQHNCKTQFKNY